VTPAANLAAADAVSSTQSPTGPRASLWTLRVIVSLHALFALAQPVLAGAYLNGEFDALSYHGINADLVIFFDMVQFVVAVIYCWAGKGSGLPALLSVALFFAEGLQIGMGYERNLLIHIPLGVGIVVLQLALAVWVWRAKARRPRSWGLRARPSKARAQARPRP